VFFTLVGFGLVVLVLEVPFYLSHEKWSRMNLWPAMPVFWKHYTQFDPIFEHPTPLIVLQCWIECLMFGPLYFLSAFWIYRREFSAVVIPSFCGALIYSTVIYFGMELLEWMEGTNMTVVVLANIPWTILPVFLLLVNARNRGKKVKKS
jgi:hypothetical protein